MLNKKDQFNYFATALLITIFWVCILYPGAAPLY